MLKSKLVVHDNLPSAQKIMDSLRVERLILVYDNYLLNFPELRDWLASFEYGFSVVAGEDLKDIKNFPELAKRFHHSVQGFGPSKIGMAVVGGGTIGDTFGFLASIFKRGIPFFSVPSTWLAALDSAHGGKTGLNIGVHKNQVGSFYPAKEIWISKKLLSTQSDVQRSSAFGELAKMAILCGGPLYKNLVSAKVIDDLLIWKLLPKVIAAKNQIVKQDPFEKKGLRYALNLGHTLGHALELHHNLPHGEAVRLGLVFSAGFSLQRKYLKPSDHQQILKLLNYSSQSQPKLNQGHIAEALRHDKKITEKDQVNFVFIDKPGKHGIEAVSVDEILKECGRQGWIK